MKRLLKKFRYTQPFNLLATSSVKLFCQLTHKEPQYLMRVLHRTGKIKVKLPRQNDGRGKYFFLYGFGDEGGSSFTYWRGWDSIEPETLPVWHHLSLRAKIVLDIGAHIGHMSLISAACNPRARVCAFEPFQPAYERLKLHKALNRFPNLELYPIAISDKEGMFPFYYLTDSFGHNSSFSRSFVGDGSSHKISTTDVHTVTIDAWAESHGAIGIDLVKIDTESWEPQVLKGMRKTLLRDHPDLIVECLPSMGTEKKVKEILEPLEYRAYPLVCRTVYQNRIHEIQSRWANRKLPHTHNILFTARDYAVDRLFSEADNT